MIRSTIHDKIFVIGGGPSLAGFDFTRLTNAHTIAVNKSFLSVPNLDYFISVDFTFLQKINRNQFKTLSATKIFVADLSYPFLKEVDGRIMDTRFNLIYRLGDYDMIVKSRKKEGMGLTFKDFRTGKNSGFCALQLAVILGFKKIYLLGMDLCSSSSTHYHNGYGEEKKQFNKKLEEYFIFFEKGLSELRDKSDVEVFSCSKKSKLNSIIPFCDVNGVV